MPVRRSTAALSSGRMPSRVQHPRANLDPGRRPAIPRSLQGHPSAHAPRRRPSRVGTAFRRNASQAEPFRPVGVGATRSRTAANTRGRGRVTSRPLGWPAPAIALVGLVTVLVGIGIIMVLSASMGYSLSKEGTPWATFERQVVWVAMGIAVFGAVSLIDYRLWRRLDGVLIAGVFLALLVVLSPLGIRKNGSQRWIGTGGLQIQPSELAKFAIAVWLSALLASRARKIHNPRLTTRPALVATAAVVVLVMLQPDMGTAIIVSIIAASVLVASGIGLRRLGSIGLCTVGLAVLAGMLEPYRRDRILSFLHPGSDAANTGFQLSQSLVGLGSGHVFGVGIGAGRAKLGFLPNSSTDFIMAIIGEELGLVGTLTVVALFAGLAVVGTHIARRAPDDFGYLLGIGLTAWLVGQAAINIGAVIGIMPITGVPLPFISAGGSSFVVVMAAVGVLVSIGRRAISVERRSDLVSLIDDAPLLAAEVRAGVRRHPSGRVRERARKKRQEPSGSRDGRRRPASPIDATRPDASRPDAPIPRHHRHGFEGRSRRPRP